jgi:hypothetical protein
MVDEKWQKVREIFDSALRRKPEERRKFVNEVCGDDKTLLAEVESLLSSLDNAESFMETPAVAKVADVIEAETRKLERGKCFGHYEIIRQIGAGGMGEVYLAQDKKLDQRVAVKILNEKFNRDESNLQRFISKAKAASALNHPNILVIHEIGEAGEAHYIVSEFIKDKTLHEIFEEKTLKLLEVLGVLIQIANGFAQLTKRTTRKSGKKSKKTLCNLRVASRLIFCMLKYQKFFDKTIGENNKWNGWLTLRFGLRF